MLRSRRAGSAMIAAAATRGRLEGGSARHCLLPPPPAILTRGPLPPLPRSAASEAQAEKDAAAVQVERAHAL